MLHYIIWTKPRIAIICTIHYVPASVFSYPAIAPGRLAYDRTSKSNTNIFDTQHGRQSGSSKCLYMQNGPDPLKEPVFVISSIFCIDLFVFSTMHHGHRHFLHRTRFRCHCRYQLSRCHNDWVQLVAITNRTAWVAVWALRNGKKRSKNEWTKWLTQFLANPNMSCSNSSSVRLHLGIRLLLAWEQLKNRPSSNNISLMGWLTLTANPDTIFKKRIPSDHVLVLIVTDW